MGIRKRSFDFQRKIFCTFSVTDSTSGTSSRVRPHTPHHAGLMFATHAAWSLASAGPAPRVCLNRAAGVDPHVTKRRNTDGCPVKHPANDRFR